VQVAERFFLIGQEGAEEIGHPISSNVIGHIRTDKPLYKPNDVVFVEVYLINPTSKKPFLGQSTPVYRMMQVYDLDGLPIFETNATMAYGGTVAFTFKVPQNITGGEYNVVVKDTSLPMLMRKIRISQDPKLALFITATFDKKNYSPGMEV